jgi:hypothetical protein
MINKAFDRHLFLTGGAVKLSGGSLNLAKGQLAIVDLSATTPDGAKVLSGFLGKAKNKKDLAIRVGVTSKDPNRSYSDKAESTPPFALNEVKALRVSVPERTEQSVDELIIGYDGFDPTTAFKFKAGDAYFNFALELKGGLLDYRGGGESNCEIVHVSLDIADYDPFNSCEEIDGCLAIDCKSLTLAAIEQLKRRQVTGGGLVEDFVDITPVFSCDNDVTATLIPYDFYSLEVCDAGGDEALALIQAQYPDSKVARINRKGSSSTYQILLPQADGAPADYEQGIPSLLKGCEDCPAGYSEVDGGFLYAITIADGGADRTPVITASLAAGKLVAGTVVRGQGNDGSVGFYTAIYTSPLTQAEIDTFVNSTNDNRDTATVAYVGVAQDICENATVSESTWVLGNTCNVVEETYKIVLPDNKCGEDRLAELSGNYPNLTIVISDSANSTLEVTLTGTEGGADVTVDGDVYTATYATSLTATAGNFVTANAATILSAAGVTVTADAGVLTFSGPTAIIEGILIANDGEADSDLDGTLGDVEAIPARQGCQTQYETTITSNLVCEECDPVFQDYYRTAAPAAYFETLWTKVEDTTTQPNGNCLCGIRVKGKTFLLTTDEALRDVVGFTETSTLVRMSAGFPSEIREGIGFLPEGSYVPRYFSRWIQRTHLAGNLRDLEKEGRAYFLGEKYNHSYLTRVLRGETSNMEDQLAQYAHYTVEIGHEGYTQGFARTNSKNIEYHIWVELGRHFELETLLNNLASNAGVPTVQATAV